METNDATSRPGRHKAEPATPPVSRRELRAAERRESSSAEDPWDFRAPPARPRRASATVARRTALSMAGSGAALVGIAVVTHKAPDDTTLYSATRDITKKGAP